MPAFAPLFATDVFIEKPRQWQIGVTAGLNSIGSEDPVLKNNRGAEFGIIATLPYTLWKEDASIVVLRGQFTGFPQGIQSQDDSGNEVLLINASHAQARFDFRQVFVYWGIHWSVGLGLQIPITSRILTPRGEFNFRHASAFYKSADSALKKIDSATAGYIRLGVDQKFLDDTLLLGLGLEISFAESPKTEQKTVINFYAGARVW